MGLSTERPFFYKKGSLIPRNLLRKSFLGTQMNQQKGELNENRCACP